MSGKDCYPPPGQAEPTSGDTTIITDTQSSRPATPQPHSVPPRHNNNVQVHKQTAMPQQQYVQSNPQPMPPQNQMQYGQQQQYNQQQYYQQQPMPQQFQQQTMPQNYAQPMPQNYVQPMPQQYYGQQMPNAQPVMMVPSPVPIMSAPTQPWTTGLFDCADDPNNCVVTFFFPCITLGQVAEITDSGRTTCSTAAIMYFLLLYFTGLQWIYSMMYRSRLRALYSLQEDPFHDCLVHFFCDPCALCQEYRELQNRGFNMQLGWLGNVQLQAQRQAAATSAPVPVQGMTR